MIFGGALLAAALLTWFLWAETKAPKTERMVRVVAAARDMPAGTRLRQADLKLVGVPEKDVPRTALLDPQVALDRALLFPIGANEPVTVGKLTSSSGADGISATIEHGKRAISVQITDSSGVAGLITPRSRVDVLFTHTGSMTEALTNVILEDVTVLSIGRTTEVQPVTAPATGVNPQAAQRSQTTTATLLVTPEQAARLELAKNQGKIGLALRNPLDRSTVSQGAMPVTAEALDPLVWARSSKRRPSLSAADLAKIKDPKEWARLTSGEEEKPKPKPVVEKKEPPKPRYVIDVFRGDKHLQETFQ
jgi:pilus assembly protein CpaB